MDIRTNHITTTKTCRFATYGQLSERTKYFWFCLHGTKMVCDQMIYKFSEFDPETHYVVAPEGMSRVYANGFGGEVVATWMTSRDRLEEINDFSNYLSLLYNQEVEKLPATCKKILFGFSQGGTTLYRWLHSTKTAADFLIGHSCWIPEEIDLKEGKTDFNQIPSVYTYGKNDQFLTDERIAEVEAVISKNNLKVEVLPFEGEHRIEKAWLRKLWQEQISDEQRDR